MPTKANSLTVDPSLSSFLTKEVLPGLSIRSEDFWSSFESILDLFQARNSVLLEERKNLQTHIDQYHIQHRGEPHNAEEYHTFLRTIGYLQEEGEDFCISTAKVDPEIATIAAPQLVVPIANARFALNAANARWGSLYDALYGTNVIAMEKGEEIKAGFDPVRGMQVVAFAKHFLNDTIPYEDVVDFVLNEELGELEVVLSDATRTKLMYPKQFVGYTSDCDTQQQENSASSSSSSPHTPRLRCLLFKHNNLHLEIQRDFSHFIGQDDPAGIKDIVLEAAVTTIQDCEDSVAAVDAEDKIGVYRNWLGLMKGDLTAQFQKKGQEVTRSLTADRLYSVARSNHRMTKKTLVLPGRSVLLIRNVGHLMTTSAILDRHGQETPEGIMDAMFSILIAKHKTIPFKISGREVCIL